MQNKLIIKITNEIGLEYFVTSTQKKQVKKVTQNKSNTACLPVDISVIMG